MSPKNDAPKPSRSSVAPLVALVICGVLVGSLLSAQEKSAQKDGAKNEADSEFYNAEYAKIKNPEKDTPENIAAGRAIYQQHCANCHGKTGLGDGGDNRGGTPIPNLVDDEWLFGSTDGEIFMVIKEGTTSPDMTAYKDVLEEKEMWQSILFFRSLAKKPRTGN